MKGNDMQAELTALGIESTIIRGNVCVASMFVNEIVDGIPLSYTRRRYGSTTFTWVDAFIGGEWVSLGDPWPCIKPKRSDIIREISIRKVPA